MKITDLITTDKELKKKNKDRDKSSPVRKNVNVNRAQTHKDKKKAKNNPRKNTKHKGQLYEAAAIFHSMALYENKDKVWTKEEIREKLKTNDQWVIRGLLAIYDRQTEEEQSSHATNQWNGVGFNAYDAEFMTGSVEFYKNRGFLSKKHLNAVRKALIKYSGQLARIANGQA